MAAVPSRGRASRVEDRAAPEADATRELYERYRNQLYGYCLHQLGSREEAEDAVQSTFLNAFRGLRRGVVPEAEQAWLFKIAQNVCLSRHRSHWRRWRIESPADFEVAEETTAAPTRRADELIGLQDVLEHMPENQRRAILLREWQGLSYREIAEELELSQAAVETLIFRARRALAQGLEASPAEQRSWRARLQPSFGLGSVASALKSLFASSLAVKAVGTAAVVAVTSAVVATPTHHPRVHHTQHAARPAAAATTLQQTVSAQQPSPLFGAPLSAPAAQHARRKHSSPSAGSTPHLRALPSGPTPTGQPAAGQPDVSAFSATPAPAPTATGAASGASPNGASPRSDAPASPTTNDASSSKLPTPPGGPNAGQGQDQGRGQAHSQGQGQDQGSSHRQGRSQGQSQSQGRGPGQGRPDQGLQGPAGVANGNGNGRHDGQQGDRRHSGGSEPTPPPLPLPTPPATSQPTGSAPASTVPTPPPSAPTTPDTTYGAGDGDGHHH